MKIQLIILLLLLKTATETKQWSEWPPGEITRVRVFATSFTAQYRLVSV